jgi:hypothetical protein
MEEMLALARGKLKQEPPGRNGALILHDFAGGPLPGRYGAGLITFYTFNYNTLSRWPDAKGRAGNILLWRRKWPARGKSEFGRQFGYFLSLHRLGVGLSVEPGIGLNTRRYVFRS